jgi:hypothetical protein
MKTNSYSVLLQAIFGLLALITYCTQSNPVSDSGEPYDIAYLVAQTPKDDMEAELAALWLSDELVAPQALYDEIREGLHEIRSQYWEQVEGVAFWPPFVSSHLTIKITDSAKAEIRNGNYHAWDDLNDLFRLIQIDTSLFTAHPDYRYIYLRFQGRLNPYKLSDFYDTLTGIEYAGASGVGPDGSVILPWIVNDTLVFLCSHGWGDCWSGCIFRHNIYFKQENGFYYIAGEYLPHEENEPGWWKEIKCAPSKFDNYDDPDCE